eukprot:TRINITY_DN51036_c0_g1_i1.p1 TRINITY_DN51036_c0_g1~~TRINITY_DN51036_c0_g1_i1.p1  ORF type:complete len:1380 (-),score=249.71 TRINITY_DN51036_c0_g1_i1:80-4219(-)
MKSLAATAPLRLGGLCSGLTSDSSSGPGGGSGAGHGFDENAGLCGAEPEKCIFTWGDNSSGQCLFPTVSPLENEYTGCHGAVSRPRRVPCKRPMRTLAAGWEQSLLIDLNGGIWGGGCNREHVLSEESVSDDNMTLTRLDLLEVDGVPFEAVQLGREHVLSILEGGKAVVAWGSSNEFGQLGHGVSSSSAVRPGVVHLSGIAVKQVACGEYHSLVLTVQGELFSFGSNVHGALGSGRRESYAHAERVSSNHLRAMPLRGIAAGAQSSMALSIGGHVFSWGSNSRGRLGLGPAYDHEDAVLTPVTVPNLPGMARAIAAGGQHSAVILRRGRLFLAGDNYDGQLGQPRLDLDWTSTFYEFPFHDYSLRVRAVALGRAHTVVLSYDGELYTCGRNAEAQLGNGMAEHSPSEPAVPACDVPVRLSLGAMHEEFVVIGIAACHDHTVVLALAMPDTLEKAPIVKQDRTARPQTSAMARAQGAQVVRADFSQTLRPSSGLLKDTLRTIHEGGEQEREREISDAFPFSGALPMDMRGRREGRGFHRASTAMPSTLTSGCQSRLHRGGRNLVVPLTPKRKKLGSGGLLSPKSVEAAPSYGNDAEGTAAEDVVLLQPVVQPGLAGSVGFAAFSVPKLSDLVSAAVAASSTSGAMDSALHKSSEALQELQQALAAALATPSLLNASFCFPGLYRPRLDAGGLLKVFKELSTYTELFAKVELHMYNAAFEGLGNWATDHDEAAALVHRDQLRGVAVLLLSPILQQPQKAQSYELMSRIMRLVAWMPPEGRRELQEVVVEDCSEEEVLRSLVRRVREHCDETVRRAHQMQRLSPEIWEGLMLLQLLWGANEAVAKRLDQSLRTQPEFPEPQELAHSLTQSLSKFNSSDAGKTLLDRFVLGAPQLRPPVPASDFHLQSLAEELVPPELEFRLFIENACAGPITPKEVLDLPLYAARTDYGFEYVLPSKMRSFMANRNLVPVSYTRKVLQVENHHAQVYLQHQVARRVAEDLEVLPGHEIHIDPALLFFILKVRRDYILEDTTMALQRATPEDLRRQLKVVFDGEQGVDEGGLAREFFRLLSARVFTADSGLFDPSVAANARVLWFDRASSCESTDFWLAGVILGLVVYNNMPGLDVRFPAVVFKKIKDEPLGLEDLRQVHPDTYLSLRSLLNWEPEEGLSSADASELFENTFCLDFNVSYDGHGTTQSQELCEGGKDRPVNLENRAEFVRLYCEWLLTRSVERQFEPFRKGVRRVCDSSLFNALDSAELEMIVCGEQDLDFSQLRRNAHYEGYTEDCPYIDAFWRFLLGLDPPQKKRFLSFVTGSDLAPVGGLQELQLVIQRNGGEPTERLPTAHTCFNLLLLPEYDDCKPTGKLERMLTMAMHNAEGFGLE